MVGAITDYALFGWRVRSGLPLPELVPWRGCDRAPDIEIGFGAVPPLAGTVHQHSPAVELGEGQVRLVIPGIAAYRIDGAREVTIEPFADPGAADIRVFLFGTVLAVLCYRHGLLPLHAAMVEIDGGAILIAGNSGLGKSTLAAALAARGLRLLSDDLCAFDVRPGSAPQILPPFPRLRLWADSAAALGIATEGAERSPAPMEKYHLAVPSFRPDPLPPRLIVLLRRAGHAGETGLRPIAPAHAMRRFDLVHRRRIGIALGHQPLIFTRMAALAKAVPIVELSRLDDLRGLDALAEAVVEAARRAAP